jgi:hypothetical protein
MRSYVVVVANGETYRGDQYQGNQYQGNQSKGRRAPVERKKGASIKEEGYQYPVRKGKRSAT